MSKRSKASYFKVDNTDTCTRSLPVPSSPAEKTANLEITKDTNSTPSKGLKRKRGQYGDYSPETKGKIAKFAIENGNSKTACHFSRILEWPINKSTVRGIKASYLHKQRLQCHGSIAKITTRTATKIGNTWRGCYRVRSISKSFVCVEELSTGFQTSMFLKYDYKWFFFSFV